MAEEDSSELEGICTPKNMKTIEVKSKYIFDGQI